MQASRTPRLFQFLSFLSSKPALSIKGPLMEILAHSFVKRVPQQLMEETLTSLLGYGFVYNYLHLPLSSSVHVLCMHYHCRPLYMSCACTITIVLCTRVVHALPLPSSVHVLCMHYHCRPLYMCCACTTTIVLCPRVVHALPLPPSVHMLCMHYHCRPLYMCCACTTTAVLCTLVVHACLAH